MPVLSGENYGGEMLDEDTIAAIKADASLMSREELTNLLIYTLTAQEKVLDCVVTEYRRRANPLREIITEVKGEN